VVSAGDVRESVDSERALENVRRLREKRERLRALRAVNRVRVAPLSVADRIVLASLLTATAFAVTALVVWGLR